MNPVLFVLVLVIAPAFGHVTVAQKPCPSALSGDAADVGDTYHDTYRATPLALGPTWACKRPS